MRELCKKDLGGPERLIVGTAQVISGAQGFPRLDQKGEGCDFQAHQVGRGETGRQRDRQAWNILLGLFWNSGWDRQVEGRAEVRDIAGGSDGSISCRGCCCFAFSHSLTCCSHSHTGLWRGVRAS